MRAKAISRPRLPYVPLLLVLVAAAVVFVPLCWGEFSGLDDNGNLVHNPEMNPPSLRGVAWSWTHPFRDLYMPATYTVWSAVAGVARMRAPDGGLEFNPCIFHIVNVAFHLGSAAAAFFILRKLAKRDWPACLGAILFAIHPVQVEAVAWVSGLKDVLAGFFSLLAILSYLHASEPPRLDPDVSSPHQPVMLYVAATLFFLLAMLSKPSAVILPSIIGAIDLIFRRHRLSRILIVVGIGLAIAAPFVVVGKLVQPASSLRFVPSIWSRPLIALDAIAFYLGKLIVPMDFAIDYGRTPQWLFGSPQRCFTWLAPAVVVTACIIFRRRFPAVLAGVTVFILAVLPVLGFVNFDFQAFSTVSDHYLYLAMLGPAIILASLLAQFHEVKFAWAIGSLWLVTLAIIAHLQTYYWLTSPSLYEHTLEVNPMSLAANVNLGRLYADNALVAAKGGHTPEVILASDRAIALLSRALQLVPDDPGANRNIANMYYTRGRFADAIRHYQTYLKRAGPDPEVEQSLADSIKKLSERGGR